MNQYVTGAMIRKLREQQGMTQSNLAEKLAVSDKTISKWETGKGFPDITLLPSIAEALGISIIELLSGSSVTNGNRCGNMKKVRFYVCPVCGNVITSAGDAVISCCGITLPPLEAEKQDPHHALSVQRVEDAFYVTVDHPMTKDHFISFLAAVSDNGVELVKLYPEGEAEARLKISRTHKLYLFCNRHGLFELSAREIPKS